MKIAILSDSHDHVWNLRRVVAEASTRADVLIHCGDLCSPFTVPILAEFPGPVHVVFGNNDGDRFRIERVGQRFPNLHLHGESFFGEIGTTKVAVVHFDDEAPVLAESGRFELVAFGHDHQRLTRRVERTWLVNPGAILGYQPSAGEDVDVSFAIYDPDAQRPEIVLLRNGEFISADDS